MRRAAKPGRGQRALDRSLNPDTEHHITTRHPANMAEGHEPVLKRHTSGRAVRS